MFKESDVADGSGPVYTEVVSAIQLRSVGNVAIFGYSQGGGATYVLANALNSRRATIGTFLIPYTGYIDAVEHTGTGQELRRPPGTQFHVNYYQENGAFELGGGPVPNSVPGTTGENVTLTTWGASLDHYTIDNDPPPNVQSGVRERIPPRVPR